MAIAPDGFTKLHNALGFALALIPRSEPLPYLDHDGLPLLRLILWCLLANIRGLWSIKKRIRRMRFRAAFIFSDLSFTLQRQDAKHALMYAIEWLPTHKAFEQESVPAVGLRVLSKRRRCAKHNLRTASCACGQRGSRLGVFAGRLRELTKRMGLPIPIEPFLDRIGGRVLSAREQGEGESGDLHRCGAQERGGIPRSVGNPAQDRLGEDGA